MRYIIISFIALFFLVACSSGTTTVVTTEKVPVEPAIPAEPIEKDGDTIKDEIQQDNSEDSEVGMPSKVESKPVEEYIEKEVVSTIPRKKEYDIPFTSQAPFANWDPPYDEACEEASMIMVARYLSGASLTRTAADKAIIELAEWEKNNGYAIDISVAETKEVFENYFNYKAEVNTDVSIERIKKELAEGSIIIIPAAGRLLGNPYFSGAGPVYHMLVITGYTDTTFITNDPGTRRGDGYEYNQSVVINAIHDWEPGVLDSETKKASPEKMLTTQKAMLIINTEQ